MTPGQMLVVGTVALTIVALVAYRALGKRGEQIPLGGHSLVLGCPTMVNMKTIMMVLVSLLVLGSSLYIILSSDQDRENQKWAFGAVGSIMGFWLRPEKVGK